MNSIKVFNPEHDMALANGDRHFIAPRNIREMARDLASLLEVIESDELLVWGWDHAIKVQLQRMGIAEEALPTDDALTALRKCSERQSAHHLLRAFHADHPDGPYTGESIIAHDIDEIASYTTQHGHIILKDPLSSSGKGLRHVSLPLSPSRRGETSEASEHSREDMSSLEKVESWANALINRHGYLTAEPYYNKVQDFAMEFRVEGEACRFIGYSFFNTNHHGRYENNLLMEDGKIESLLTQHIPRAALHEVQAWIIGHCKHIVPTEWDTTKHPLYFGIDMMIVKGENRQPQLHPCVEINLRLNMGIIAHEVHRKLLAPGVEGSFHVTSFPSEEAAQLFHQEQTTQFPSIFQDEKIISGYYPLTPIHPHTRHHAYISCGQRE